ncbi:MAG TPA: hypothetical protein VF715_07950 [Thermoleophilaceae bacterium]|jgi:hypothetical protein
MTGSTSALGEAAPPDSHPRSLWAVVLGVAALSALTAVGAVGLPESAIHFSDDAEWAYRAGREISLGALVLGAAIAALLAWRSGYGVPAIAGLALVTLLLATVGRDLYARDQQPSWCYADTVEATPGGAISLEGEHDGCTVLLPAKEI